MFCVPEDWRRTPHLVRVSAMKYARTKYVPVPSSIKHLKSYARSHSPYRQQNCKAHRDSDRRHPAIDIPVETRNKDERS